MHSSTGECPLHDMALVEVPAEERISGWLQVGTRDTHHRRKDEYCVCKVETGLGAEENHDVIRAIVVLCD